MKPKYHYAWFEAAPKFEDDQDLVKLNSYTWARKTKGVWQLGWGRATHFTGKKLRPVTVNTFGLDFHPDRVIMSRPNAGKPLGIKSQSQLSRNIKSPIYTYGPIEVQGEGALIIEHDLDGTIRSVHTERPALQKTWDEQKYKELKEIRTKAERTLKVMMKMGVLEGSGPTAYGVWNIRQDLERIDYGSLLQQLADADGRAKDKDLDALANLIARCRGLGGFEYVQRKFREMVYRQKGTYTWEPVEDGRDRVDF